MKRVLSIVRASLVVIVGCGVAISATGLSPHLASAQAAITPMQTLEEVELTPWEQSAEVKDLLRGTFVPDPGEPAGAIKAYLATDEKVRKARRRIEAGKLPGEPAFDPEHLLNEALIVRRRSTALYPTSRHAWEGVGDVFWLKYKGRHKSADLREAVDAYERAAELLKFRPNADTLPKPQGT